MTFPENSPSQEPTSLEEKMKFLIDTEYEDHHDATRESRVPLRLRPISFSDAVRHRSTTVEDLLGPEVVADYEAKETAAKLEARKAVRRHKAAKASIDVVRHND